MSKIFPCLFLLVLFSHNLKAQSSAAMLQELLDLPSPPAFDSENYYSRDDDEKTYPEEFYSRLAPPADDAPLEELLTSWSEQADKNQHRWDKMIASEKTSARIIEYCKQDPDNLSDFVLVLPSKPDFVEAVEQMYEKAQETDDELGSEVEEWLKENSQKFIAETLEELKEITDKDDYLDDPRELLSLARVDWKQAQPFIEILEAEKDKTPLRTLALG